MPQSPADPYRLYAALPAEARLLAQLLSALYAPVPRTALVKAMAKADLRDPGGKRITATTLDYCLKPLGTLLVTRGDQFALDRRLVEIAARDAVRQGHFDRLVAAVHEVAPLYETWGGAYAFHGYEQMLCHLRLALYGQEWKRLERVIAAGNQQFPREALERPPLAEIVGNPFDAEWLQAQPQPLIEAGLLELVRAATGTLAEFDAPLACLERLGREAGAAPLLRQALAEQWLLRGRFIDAAALLAADASAGGLALCAALAFLDDDNPAALALFDTALKQLRKDMRKRKVAFAGLAGVFQALALLKSGEPRHHEQASELLGAFAQVPGHPLSRAFPALLKVAELVLTGRGGAAMPTLAAPQGEVGLWTLFKGLALYWLDAPPTPETLATMRTLRARAGERGYAWVAAEAEALLARWEGGAAADTALLATVPRVEAWARALSALCALKHARPEAAAGGGTRLVWILGYREGDCSIEPREQKLDARGRWTPGRAVALKRLYPGADPEQRPACLTGHDRRVCEAIDSRRNYYGYAEIELDRGKALAALVGHPLLFTAEQPTVPVELVRAEPELRIAAGQGQLRLSLEPYPEGADRPWALRRDGPGRLVLVRFTDEHFRLADILGPKSLRVPEAGRAQVLDVVSAVSGLVTVHSDIGGADERLEVVEADATPHLRLMPSGAGLAAELRVLPLGSAGPALKPGSGGATLIAELDGRRVQARREPKRERALAKAVLDACPTLAAAEAGDGFVLDTPEQCLEALLELHALDQAVHLDWPEGQRFRVRPAVDTPQLRLRVERQADWFAVDGRLAVDEGLVLDLQRLLDAGVEGRFLALGEGEFLALTDRLRRRLEQLRGLGDAGAKGLRLHRLAVEALEELSAEVGAFDADAHWRTALERLRAARAFEPVLPGTLQAELRDYQLEGFRWLARLAHWGVGACLADDMGLGKTVQALALILSRATEGPTLVVAPTSVCANWLTEAARFAPTLNPVPFDSRERRGALDTLGPRDLVVCSYALLQLEAEAFAAREWTTVVLDEAQAVKNAATKRSQAVMALRGGFRMITTGTPVENHLGELWNLFRFVNPGLLGSLESFNRRFAHPIERNQDAAARGWLRRLIQPFILRRSKTQVLTELPPRTEVVLHVEPSAAERALYEALRREALEALARAEPGEDQRFRILAELMRLRRACCHPRLVLPDTALPGSKLALFGEVLDELRDNRHKALVFSQFVDHLAIVREWLEARGIVYQYLDGSTPAAERKRRVDAFQAGEGEVFLISLKAGGTGLNLTAADYVIHLDPWWNPAAEDQASDRTHRIGQSRPVTVYRLVTEGTIEEKIVDLHRRKRDLADSLLKGTDAGARLSADELMALLREA